MTVAAKVKVSVSIGADVLEVVDGQAAREGTTRSAVMERWLRQSSRTNATTRLAEDTAAYYDRMTACERQDSASLGSASSAAARRLRIDDAPTGSATRGRASRTLRRVQRR